MENVKYDDQEQLELNSILYIISVILLLSYFVGMFAYYNYFKRTTKSSKTTLETHSA